MSAVLALVLLVVAPLFFAPALAQEPETLEATSDEGTFVVRMEWTPADLGAGNMFALSFVEPETGREIEDVVYDFIVVSEGGEEIVDRRSQTLAVQDVSFQQEGSYTVRVANIEGLGEDAEFSVRVTPEFSPALVAAAGVAVAVFVARFRFGL
jgi:hypothetical protein